jgi:hypothetical protein
MVPSMELQRWAARLCAGMMMVLALSGYYFGNIRFAPVVAGFAILAGVFYWGRLPVPSRSLSESGRHRAL